MTISKHAATHVTKPKLLSATALTATIASAALVMAFAPPAQAAAVAVPLGTAQSFSVLAGAGITNTGATTLSGDMGTFPTTSIDGQPPVVGGTNHAGDAVTKGAKDDLVMAYNVAASEGPTSPITNDLAGKTLTRGVYNSATSMGLSGALTLDAEGDPNSVFVFQMGSELTTASASSVLLTNGADPCNVYWQVGSSADLGTNSVFVGTVMALTSISLTTGARVQGRMLARNGTVTMDTNTITTPNCDTTDGGDTGGDSSSGVSDSDTTGDQITDVPSGSVDTGSGKVVEHRVPGGLLGIAALTGIAGSLAVLTYRRRTS